MRISANADQAELLAYCRGVTAVSDSNSDEQIGGIFSEPNASWGATDEKLEEHTGLTLEQLQERANRLGNAYPFQLVGGSLSYRQRSTAIYEFCLMASLWSHAKGKGRDIEIAFEIIAGEAAALLFPRGASYRIGAPSHNFSERPRRWKAAAEALKVKCGEWEWSPRTPNPIDPDENEVQDEGMDFVAWQRLDDRPGSLFIVGQCACGEDWKNKYEDLTFPRLRRWWPHMSYVSPVRAFAVPRAIPGNEVIGEISTRAGLVLDRTRLAALADGAPDTHPFKAQWHKPLRKWTTAMAEKLSGVKDEAVTKLTAKPARQPRRAAAARRSR